jgi:hypothetical protein
MLAGQMGGRILVESLVGAGSCFILSLQLPPAIEMVCMVALHMPAQTSNLRILAAEHNRANLMILRRALLGPVAQLIKTEDGLSAVSGVVSRKWWKFSVGALQEG